MQSQISNTKCKNIFIKMLKEVGMAVPKIRETRVVYMPQDKGLGHTTIIPRVTPIFKRNVGRGYAWYYIVVCHNLLSCGIYIPP